jgi:hypothetical protein
MLLHLFPWCLKCEKGQASVAHSCNLSNSRGSDQEDSGWTQQRETLYEILSQKKPITKKAGGADQGVGPEFKPQNIVACKSHCMYVATTRNMLGCCWVIFAFCSGARIAFSPGRPPWVWITKKSKRHQNHQEQWKRDRKMGNQKCYKVENWLWL